MLSTLKMPRGELKTDSSVLQTTSNASQSANAHLKGKLELLIDFGILLFLTILVIIAVLAKGVQYYAFRIDYDTAIYSNVIANLASGNWFYSDVLNRNHLGEH